MGFLKMELWVTWALGTFTTIIIAGGGFWMKVIVNKLEHLEQSLTDRLDRISGRVDEFLVRNAADSQKIIFLENSFIDLKKKIEDLNREVKVLEIGSAQNFVKLTS